MEQISYILIMMRAGSILMAVTAGLALAVPARADAPTSASSKGDNPYASLVARNVFALNPPAPPEPPTPPDPPLKITPNGIIRLFNGIPQALYKVESPPGQAPKPPKSYMLAAGQREDGIEVIKIDEKASIITFNNHGTTQDLPLVAATASTGPAPGGPPSGPGGAPQPGVIPIPNGGIPPAPGGGRFGNPMFRNRNANNPGASTGINNGLNQAGNNGFNNAYNPSGQSILGAGPAFAGNNEVNNINPGTSTAAQLQESTTSGLTPQEIEAQTQANFLKAAESHNPTAVLFPPPPH